MSRFTSFVQFVIIDVVCLAIISSACFITNCPPGGKRSGPPEFEPRKCTPCGPAKQHGQCYGSRICCSPEFGCLIGTSETDQCLVENQSTTPCDNAGKSCGGFDESQPINGHCAADGICCSSEICIMDFACHIEQIDGPRMLNVDQDEDFQESAPFPNEVAFSSTGGLAPPQILEMPAGAAFQEAPNPNLFPEMNPNTRNFLLHNKRSFDEDSSSSSSGSSRTPKTKFPVLLKSVRPGWNLIVRKLLQMEKRNKKQMRK